MNLQHLKYVIEIDKTGSISQAAENLFMNQPNLSKAIKELEASLGIIIFRRSSKGVTPTPDGKEFLVYAHSILTQIEKMQAHFSGADTHRHTLKLSIPRSSYIAEAFTAFVASLDRDKALDITFSEVGTLQAINNILEENYHLGIIRYPAMYESYFLRYLRDRGLASRELWAFDYLALMSQDHPLAYRPDLNASHLRDYIEIAHGDLSIPNLAIPRPEGRRGCIYVQERGSQLDLLARIPETYMWVSAMPQDLLERNRLVQRRCDTQGFGQKDVLIYAQGHVFGGLETCFLQNLEEVKTQVTAVSEI